MNRTGATAFPGGGIVGQGGERIRGLIEELGCEVQVSREPLAGIAGHKRVTWRSKLWTKNVWEAEKKGWKKTENKGWCHNWGHDVF